MSRPTPPPESLRQLQKAALKDILAFSGHFDGAEENPIWKILVFDAKTQSILAPSLKVSELRDAGVTMFRNINSIDASCTIPDVAVIYFVEATTQNFDLICTHLQQSIFSAAFCVWPAGIKAAALDEFAQKAVQFACAHKIHQVYDGYCDFVCLDDNLFTLSMPNAFSLLYGEKSSGDDAEAAIRRTADRIAEQLVCVAATAGALPVIRCAAGGAAELVATLACAKMRDHVLASLAAGTSHIFAPRTKNRLFAAERPLLVLLDRTLDVGSVLMHSWSYNALLHDIFGLHLMRSTVAAAPNEPAKNIDIDVEEDFFWRKYAKLPSYEVAAAVDSELAGYVAEKDRITRITGCPPEEALDAAGETAAKLSASTPDAFKSVLDAIPALTQQKKCIDLHTHIATALIRRVSDAKLDTFIAVESQLLTQSASKSSIITKETIGAMIAPSAPGSPTDKLRLLLVFLLRRPALAKADVAQLKEALNDATAAAAVDSFVQLHAASSLPATPSPISPTPAAASIRNTFQMFSSANSKLSGVLGNLVSGLKNLLPDSCDLPVAQITEQLLTVRSGTLSSASPLGASSTGGSSTDSFLYLDPKALKASDRRYVPDRDTFSSVFVFVVGGASYAEYNSLEGLAKKYPRLRMTFGSTEIVRPASFIQNFAADKSDSYAKKQQPQ